MSNDKRFIGGSMELFKGEQNVVITSAENGQEIRIGDVVINRVQKIILEIDERTCMPKMTLVILVPGLKISLDEVTVKIKRTNDKK